MGLSLTLKQKQELMRERWSEQRREQQEAPDWEIQWRIRQHRARRRERRTQTYFILSPTLGAIKIGKTAQGIRSRMSEMATYNPDKLRVLYVLNGDHELSLHNWFASCRISNEWFKAEPVLDFINDLKLNGPRKIEG